MGEEKATALTEPFFVVRLRNVEARTNGSSGEMYFHIEKMLNAVRQASSMSPRCVTWGQQNLATAIGSVWSSATPLAGTTAP